jgi:hypothetical protein
MHLKRLILAALKTVLAKTTEQEFIDELKKAIETVQSQMLTYSPPFNGGDSRLKQQLQAKPDLDHLTQWLMPQPFEY